MLLSCLEDFLYDEDAAAVVATGLPPIAASRAASLASTKRISLFSLVLDRSVAEDFTADIVVVYA